MRKIGYGLIAMAFFMIFWRLEAEAAAMIGVCGWCGNQCTRLTTGMACLNVVAPEGKVCVEKSGTCVIKEAEMLTPTPMCINRPACLNASPPCKIAEPISGWCSVTPVPTSGNCKTGVNSFSVDTDCGTGQYRYSTYECQDGSSSRLGGEISCKTSATWRMYAEEACRGKSSCHRVTPTPIRACRECASGPGHKSGNVNCDGKVDMLDYVMWKNEFIGSKGLQTDEQGANNWQSDFDCNGVIDMVDFMMWKKGYVEGLLPTRTMSLTGTPRPTLTGMQPTPTSF